MSLFDIILLIILGLGAYKGFRNGFIVETLTFVAFFIGIFIALEFTVPVSQALIDSDTFYAIGSILVFITLLILVSIGIRLLANTIKRIIDFTPLGAVDNLFGGAIGVLKYGFIMSTCIWLVSIVGIESISAFGEGSSVYPYVRDVAPFVFENVSQLAPFFEQLLEELNDLSESSKAVIT